jgi:Cu/Ag efflux protein CusF
MKQVVVLVLAAAFVCGGVAMAADTQGKIQSIDAANKQVSLDNGTMLVLDEAVMITIEGKEGKLEDLKEGSKVKASYEEKDGKNVAKMLEVSE